MTDVEEILSVIHAAKYGGEPMLVIEDQPELVRKVHESLVSHGGFDLDLSLSEDGGARATLTVVF